MGYGSYCVRVLCAYVCMCPSPGLCPPECFLYHALSVVFNMHVAPSQCLAFDELLLLKRGGETIFFGAMGEEQVNLITHFESVPHVAK